MYSFWKRFASYRLVAYPPTAAIQLNVNRDIFPKSYNLRSLHYEKIHDNSAIYEIMKPEFQIIIPLISALASALIGASASIITIFLQISTQNKRERISIVAELARQEYTNMAYKTNTYGGFPPLVHYLHYHLGLMKLIEKEDVSVGNLAKLKTDSDNIRGVFSGRSDEQEG